MDRRAVPPHQPLGGARLALLRAEELQLLVLLRLDRTRHPRHPDRDRDLAHDELQALRRRGVRLRRVHHARRGVGLAHPLHALDRRLVLLHRRVPAHVPGPHLRLLQGQPRAHLAARHVHLRHPDGRGVHGLPAAVGADVLLGRSGDHLAVRGHPVRDRRGARALDPRRLRGLRRHPEPLLRPSRGGPSPRPARGRRAAHPRVARGRLEQPGRGRDQAQQGSGRETPATASPSIPTTP